MTYDHETPYIAEVTWCPECGGPPKSDFAHVQYCDFHRPEWNGTMDRLVEGNGEYIFHGEGGENARPILDFLHRQKGDLSHDEH